MDHDLFWIMYGTTCPYDDTPLNKEQFFVCNNGKLHLPKWKCPLCERTFIKYELRHDLIRHYPEIKCRFLDMASSKLDARKKGEERERLKSGEFEPTAEQLKRYKYLCQHYSMSESEFCECFSEKPQLFQFFMQKMPAKAADRQNYRQAVDDSHIQLVVRFILQKYIKLQEEKERAKYIQTFFHDYYTDDKGQPYLLDDEQSFAVAVNDSRVLAAARAGSGKTRTVVAKIVYLLDHDHVPESHILSLAFNTDVPKEINERVKKLLLSRTPNREGSIEVARTFHSLAHQIVLPKKVLFGKKRKLFIQQIISELKETDPDFKEFVYTSFRNESIKLYKSEFKNAANYYSALRNAQFETLNGEIVKSAGEKWLADYFFEHGIQYIYEPCFYPRYIRPENIPGTREECIKRSSFLDQQAKRTSKDKISRKTLKPDFLLSDYYYVWEHWGIDEADPNRYQGKTEKFEMSWSDYRDLMTWKRSFWNADWRKRLQVKASPILKGKSQGQYVERIKSIRALIESSVVEMDGGRDAFEKAIESKLDMLGIPHLVRDHDQLVEEVWRKQIKRFTVMIESFIDKYEQHFPMKGSPAFHNYLGNSPETERATLFLSLGLSVLKRYCEILSSQQKPAGYEEYSDYSLDFNQLIAQATEKIEQGKADSDILDYQYLFVDEYQDFSELFYRFISAILSRKPGIQLFCVGDTWQAINRYMGADTCYFEDFSKYFSEGRILEIRTNYRSSKRIVDLSNLFMDNCGFTESPAVSNQKDLGPQCFHYDVAEGFIALTDEYSAYEADSKIVRLLSSDKVNRETSLYLKKIFNIIKDNKGSSIYLLSRTNEFASFDISILQGKIHDYLRDELSFSKQEADRVKVMTMHKAKGLEADIIIVLEANNGNIPKVHPDNDLYSVFGETQEKHFIDEEKLFYVAITRAKKQFWVLYDGGPSEFISLLRRR